MIIRKAAAVKGEIGDISIWMKSSFSVKSVLEHIVHYLGSNTQQQKKLTIRKTAWQAIRLSFLDKHGIEDIVT